MSMIHIFIKTTKFTYLVYQKDLNFYIMSILISKYFKNQEYKIYDDTSKISSKTILYLSNILLTK